MRNHVLNWILCLALPAGWCFATQEDGLETLRRAYAAYLDERDPLEFPMKIRAVSQDPAGLWQGGKILYFEWLKTHARHWLADSEASMALHGDQHLGNIGTYLVAGKLGTSAFGMVDFDDSHVLPFQFELLQGMISIRLAARENGISLSEAQARELAETLVRTYRASAASGKSATELLAQEPKVRTLLSAAARRDYGKELKQYTDGGRRFVPVRATARGQVKDILRPAMDQADAIARGLAEAAARSPALAARLRQRDAASIRASILDVARRTRMGSAGSQGLQKYFVLMEKPLEGVDHNVIFYLKQQIPSAAERAGVAAADPRPPAQRASEHMAMLNRPAPEFNSWCAIGQESYWVTLREPWTDELEVEDFRDVAGLREAARLWATTTGATHQGPGQANRIAERDTPQLLEDLLRLSAEYERWLAAMHQQLGENPRVKELVALAEERISRVAPPDRRRKLAPHERKTSEQRPEGRERRRFPPGPSRRSAGSAPAPTGS